MASTVLVLAIRVWFSINTALPLVLGIRLSGFGRKLISGNGKKATYTQPRIRMRKVAGFVLQRPGMGHQPTAGSHSGLLLCPFRTNAASVQQSGPDKTFFLASPMGWHLRTARNSSQKFFMLKFIY